MIDESTLPQHIQDAIKESQEKPKPLFPIPIREYTLNFATKEQQEVALLVDHLIKAVNSLQIQINKPVSINTKESK